MENVKIKESEIKELENFIYETYNFCESLKLFKIKICKHIVWKVLNIILDSKIFISL